LLCHFLFLSPVDIGYHQPNSTPSGSSAALRLL